MTEQRLGVRPEDRYRTKAKMRGHLTSNCHVHYNRETDTLIFVPMVPTKYDPNSLQPENLIPEGGVMRGGHGAPIGYSQGAVLEIWEGNKVAPSEHQGPTTPTMYNPLYLEALMRLTDTLPQVGGFKLYESPIGYDFSWDISKGTVRDWLYNVGEMRAESKTAQWRHIILYHGTCRMYADEIKREGITPRSISNVQNHWEESAISRPNLVYLSHPARLTISRSAMKRARDGLYKQWGVEEFSRENPPTPQQERLTEAVMLQVRVPREGWKNLRPDEDELEYAQMAAADTGMPEWMGSIGSFGVVAYEGSVPASWIREYASGDAALRLGMVGQPPVVGMVRNPDYEGHQRALSLADRKTYLRVSDCNRCGHAIAWAKSKAGKWYPCTVVPKQSEEYGSDRDVLRAAPWQPHRCDKQKTAFISEEEHDEMVDRIAADRMGRCYELAGRYVSDHVGTELVHGSISPTGTHRFGHAWVDLPNGKVYDAVLDETFTRSDFERLFSPEELRRYDQTAVWVQSVRSRHWGPWDEHEAAASNVFWHGSPSGDMRGGSSGLHIGTRRAAEQALNARIGIPVEGYWDGTREYGKTLLKGQNSMGVYDRTGYNADGPKEDHYPTGRATYGGGIPIPLTARPVIFPVRIIGPMTNTPNTAHEDFKANGYMRAQLAKGRAKSGYYYRNVSEDEGSISAVVPGPSHVQRLGSKQSVRVSEDPGPPGTTPRPRDIVRYERDVGPVPTDLLIKLRDMYDQKVAWTKQRSKYQGDRWDEMVEDVRKNGIREPIDLIVINGPGSGYPAFEIIDGNHRLSWAKEAGLTTVPVYEIRWFGTSWLLGWTLEELAKRNVHQGIKEAAKTIRLYHGTSSLAAEIARTRGIRPLIPQLVAWEIEQEFGLPRDSVYRSGSFMFSRGRQSDPNVYVSGRPDTAQSYAKIFNEVINDALSGAYRLLHPPPDDWDDLPPGANREYAADIEKFMQQWARKHNLRPVVLELEMPVEYLKESTDWKHFHERAKPEWRDDFESWVDLMQEGGGQTTMVFPSPIPARFIKMIRPVGARWRQEKHIPDASEYVGRCTRCRRKFCWDKTEKTKRVGNVPSAAHTMFCPICRNSDAHLIQTSRHNAKSGDFHHLHDHQARQLQIWSETYQEDRERTNGLVGEARKVQALRSQDVEGMFSKIRLHHEVEYMTDPDSADEDHKISAITFDPEQKIEVKVGILAWWKRRPSEAVIYEVWVREEFQRRGLATRMLQEARKITPTLRHSIHLSPAGKEWARAVGQKEAVSNNIIYSRSPTGMAVLRGKGTQAEKEYLKEIGFHYKPRSHGYFHTDLDDKAFEDLLEELKGKGYNVIPKSDYPKKHHFDLVAAKAPTLLPKVQRLKANLARLSQEVYDAWEQDEEGEDFTYGTGGICDAIVQNWTDYGEGLGTIASDDVQFVDGGQEGDDHAWLVVLDHEHEEAVGVDIPPGHYETGYGYSWKKIPNVKFTANMVEVFPLSYEDFKGAQDWGEFYMGKKAGYTKSFQCLMEEHDECTGMTPISSYERNLWGGKPGLEELHRCMCPCHAEEKQPHFFPAWTIQDDGTVVEEVKVAMKTDSMAWMKVECPTCGAPIGYMCQAWPSGYARQPHAKRLSLVKEAQQIDKTYEPHEDGVGKVRQSPGMIKLFHFTSAPAQVIKNQGLLASKSRQYDFSGQGVWASTRPPLPYEHRIVEFHLLAGDPRLLNALNGPDTVQQAQQWVQGNHNLMLAGDVKPSEIGWIHEPWHEMYREVMRDYGNKLDSETLDIYNDNPELMFAIQYARRRHGMRKEASRRLYHGTSVALSPGMVLNPRRSSSDWESPHYDSSLVYLTDQDWQAGMYALKAVKKRGGEPHVYEVEAKDVQRDPEFLASGFGSDQWVASSARVLREIPITEIAETAPRLKKFLGKKEAAVSGTYYHLTDKADFVLRPDYHPVNNTTLGGDWPEAGIFIVEDIEPWVNGYGYWRPWVAEIQVSGAPESFKGYGREFFVGASDFDKLRVTRVIPLDAWCREEFQDWGWTEEFYATTFDTEQPLPDRFPSGYRFSGDARRWSGSQRSRYKQRVRNFARKSGRGSGVYGRKEAKTQFMYHLAEASNRDSIVQHGLNAERNYLYEDREDTIIRSPLTDVWEVDTIGLDLHFDDFIIGGRAWYSTETISPDRLKLVVQAPGQGFFVEPEWWKEAQVYIPDRDWGGMFTRGRELLDPRLFDPDTDTLRPEIRDGILKVLDAFWTPRYGDWRKWTKVYLAGSAASRWWSSDYDLDVLIGINKAALDRARPQNRGLPEEDVAAHLSIDLKKELHPLTEKTTFVIGNQEIGPFDMTFYVNPHSYTITDINPYAAYDITTDQWVQKPPKLPADWGESYFPELWWDEAAEKAEEIDKVLATDDETERREDAIVLFNELKHLRQKAYSVWGSGWLDWGNFLYQYLTQTGHMRRLYLEKHPELKKVSQRWDRAQWDARNLCEDCGQFGSKGNSVRIRKDGKPWCKRCWEKYQETGKMTFKKGYSKRGSQGKRFWHLTDDPHFVIKQVEPAEAMNWSTPRKGARLYVTSDLVYWIEVVGWAQKRKYAVEVELDADAIPGIDYVPEKENAITPEIAILSLNKAHVKRVIPIETAYREETGYEFPKTSALDTVARGFKVFIEDEQVARKLLAGTVTADELVRVTMAEFGTAGVHWWSGDPEQYGPGDDPDPVGRAFEWAEGIPFEETVVRYVADNDASDDPYENIWGECLVVLVGHTKERPDEWASAFPSGTPIELTEIHYDAGKGWRKVPAQGRRVMAASNVLYRGVKVDLPADLEEKIRALMQPPLEEDQIDQHLKIGPLLVNYLQSHHWQSAEGVGLGRHWTDRRVMGQNGAMQGARSGWPILLTAIYDPSDVDPDRWGALPYESEGEITLRPGAQITITNVEIFSSTSFKSYLGRPIQATAGSSQQAKSGVL